MPLIVQVNTGDYGRNATSNLEIKEENTMATEGEIWNDVYDESEEAIKVTEV